jgi:hypothetical protein
MKLAQMPFYISGMNGLKANVLAIVARVESHRRRSAPNTSWLPARIPAVFPHNHLNHDNKSK